MKRLFFLPFFLLVAGVATAAHPDGAGTGSGMAPGAAVVVATPGLDGTGIEAPAVAPAKETPAPAAASTTSPAPRAERGLRNRVRSAMQNSISNLQTLRAAQGTQRTTFVQRVADKLVAKVSKLLAGDSVAVAIILWFFFGGLAIHRVYLGTKGIMILWYILTCGGLGGICPLIDLITMIVDFDRMKNNNKFFSIAG